MEKEKLRLTASATFLGYRIILDYDGSINNNQTNCNKIVPEVSECLDPFEIAQNGQQGMLYKHFCGDFLYCPAVPPGCGKSATVSRSQLLPTPSALVITSASAPEGASRNSNFFEKRGVKIARKPPVFAL